jgi:hypothetical protein
LFLAAPVRLSGRSAGSGGSVSLRASSPAPLPGRPGRGLEGVGSVGLAVSEYLSPAFGNCGYLRRPRPRGAQCLFQRGHGTGLAGWPSQMSGWVKQILPPRRAMSAFSLEAAIGPAGDIVPSGNHHYLGRSLTFWGDGGGAYRTERRRNIAD